MRTGLTKKQKTTVIYFDEHSRIIEVQTHNTDLKKRLTAFAAKHQQCCRQTDADPDTGCMEFEIRKGRFSFRLTAPNAAGQQAKRQSKTTFIKRSLIYHEEGVDVSRFICYAYQ